MLTLFPGQVSQGMDAGGNAKPVVQFPGKREALFKTQEGQRIIIIVVKRQPAQMNEHFGEQPFVAQRPGQQETLLKPCACSVQVTLQPSQHTATVNGICPRPLAAESPAARQDVFDVVTTLMQVAVVEPETP